VVKIKLLHNGIMAYGKSPMKASAKNSPKKKGTHKMPDGTVMTGSTHSAKSRPVRKAKQSRSEAKETDGGIPFDKLKEGAMRRMLKIPKDGKPLTKTEVNRVTNIDDGETFAFRGNDVRMTALLKKRANLAKTMMGFKKK